jgi:tyrosinase
MSSLTTTKKNKTANTGLEKARKIPPVVPVITGAFELSINNAPSGASYIGWSLSACSLRITNQPQPSLNVILTNRGASGGQVIFRANYGDTDHDTLPLTLPGNGTPVTFFVGEKCGSPSTDDQDGGISVTDAATSNVLHQRTLMVRIRKNANILTPAERDRFLYAYAALNASAPDYQEFLDSHNPDADPEIHQRPAFLPWHRAFVLHIERRLEFVDGSVALPYWRFDQPSRNVFSPGFMGGTPNSAGRVSFDSTISLRNWTVNGTTGVIRVPGFNTNTSGGNVMNEASTLAARHCEALFSFCAVTENFGCRSSTNASTVIVPLGGDISLAKEPMRTYPPMLLVLLGLFAPGSLFAQKAKPLLPGFGRGNPQGSYAHS